VRSTLTCVTGTGARRRNDLASWLDGPRRERVLEDTLRWIKSLRLVPYDGRSMRQRFVYHGASLWWFTELFLHKERRLEHAMATLAALEAARDALAPARMEIETSSAAVRAAAEAFGAARGLPVAVTGLREPDTRDRWLSYLIALSARLTRVGRRPRRRGPPPRVAAFVHTAFWRSDRAADVGGESYVGPVLDALRARLGDGELACVGVGPRRNFRARRWWDPLVGTRSTSPIVTPIESLAARDRLAGALEIWRTREALAEAVTQGAGIHDAAVVQGCDLWPVLRGELARAARLQWPWSARAMDEAGAALDALSPGAVLTYAEAGGWGRALMIEARRRGVPSVGVQHGFIYRHWLNYRHEADELAADGVDPGFPRPDRTLVYDRYAAEYLEREGRFPAGALRVTGSAKLDQLSARVRQLRQSGRDAIRRELGVGDGQSLVVLAAKFSEIQDELPALFAAAGALPRLRLVVKPHPAETSAVYETGMAGYPNIVVAGPDADLARLLAAADGLVTMNSTVAVDGLSLEVPALVVGLPNNLSPFVDAGVMAGADRSALGEALRRLLYDQQARARLLDQAAAFVERHAMRPDGRSAARAAEDVLALIGTSAAPNA
jgi:hypothetical protein